VSQKKKKDGHGNRCRCCGLLPWPWVVVAVVVVVGHGSGIVSKVVAHHRSHSPTREPKGRHRERVQMQCHRGCSHPGESQGQAVSSARSNHGSSQKQLTNELRTGIVGGSKCSTTEATHILGRVKDRHHQQNPNAAHHRNHSPSVELCCHGGRKSGKEEGFKPVWNHTQNKTNTFEVVPTPQPNTQHDTT